MEKTFAGGGDAVAGAGEGHDRRGVGILDAEQAGELAFKMKQRPPGCGLFAEMRERAAEKIEKIRRGMFKLGEVVHQFDEVGGECEARVFAAEAVAGIGEGAFAEGVEIGFRAAGKADFAVEKEIKCAGEAAFRAEGALRERLQFAVRGGEPRDDEACVAEADFADENCGCGFHEARTRMRGVRRA